jgi:hypothetical protein
MSVLAAVCELALLVAPAFEVALDHLLVGAGGGQAAARRIDRGESARMGRTHAGVLADGIVEGTAPMCDVTIGERQHLRGAERRRSGPCLRECGPRRLDAPGGGRDITFGGARIVDGNCEIIALHALVARTHIT